MQQEKMQFNDVSPKLRHNMFDPMVYILQMGT